MSATPTLNFDKARHDYDAMNGAGRKQRRETIATNLLVGCINPDTADGAMNGDGPVMVKAAFRLADLIIAEGER